MRKLLTNHPPLARLSKPPGQNRIILSGLRRVVLSLHSLRQRKQLITIADEKDAIGRHWSGVDGACHIHLGKDLLLFSGLQNHHIAVLVSQVNLALDHQRRSPHSCQHVMDPIDLSGLRVQTVEETTEVRVINEAILDRGGRYGPSDLVVRPFLSG